MKRLILILTFCSLKAGAQTEEAAVKQVITNLFEGMRKTDSTLMKSAFAAGAILQSVDSRGGQVKIVNEDVIDFITAVSRPHAQVYDERITFDMIKIDGELATVWTPYQFYIGEKFSHCGVDSYQLVKLNGVWKIQYLIDTRRKDKCL